ncbi:unnamed protein product [Ilex paraguariensis]|uniref:Bulb-type lectin domain-containing protein n=1 Tax=Ilex paraguariensis TaxID=185542 RepID=A0ABC8R6Z7_9AQUA
MARSGNPKFSLFHGLFLILLCFWLEVCTSIDTITPTQFIKDPETIVSIGKTFKLGFFSPGNSTNRYAGILDNIPATIAVWVANRDNSLNDSSGILTISEDGNLVILNGQKEIIWSSNVSNLVANSSAQLLDIGNLVLRDNSSGRIIWESFQHPSDSCLQKMRLGTDAKTGERTLLASWKSPSDPSIGSFSAGIDPLIIPQLFVWNGSHPYWRSGPWNEDNCGSMCLNNCSCTAYSGYSGIGCMQWSGSLIDIQKFLDGGADLYIRVAYSELVRATAVFFAYVGFDAIADSTEESTRPQWNFLLCLMGSPLVYIVYTVPLKKFGIYLKYVSVLIGIGSVTGLTTTLLVSSSLFVVVVVVGDPPQLCSSLTLTPPATTILTLQSEFGGDLSLSFSGRLRIPFAVYKILQHVESYQKENKLNPLPIILCIDWNGSKRGHVYKFLRSQGFVSSYDTAHQYTDADAHKLLNPDGYRKLLKTSWNEAVFSMYKVVRGRVDMVKCWQIDSNGFILVVVLEVTVLMLLWHLTGLPPPY